MGRLPDASVNPRYYDVLAQYFARFVQAYTANGVPIDFLECFNEPTDSYTQMSPHELATFLKAHIGPTFDRLGLRPRTKLTYGGQAERSSAHRFVSAVMRDAEAAKYMDLIAYHGYDCQLDDADNPQSHCNDTRMNYHLIADLAARYGKEMWMTEVRASGRAWGWRAGARACRRKGACVWATVRVCAHDTHTWICAHACAPQRVHLRARAPFSCRCATRTTRSTATTSTRAPMRTRWLAATSTHETRRSGRRYRGATSSTAPRGPTASRASCRPARPGGSIGTWLLTLWAVRTAPFCTFSVSDCCRPSTESRVDP